MQNSNTNQKTFAFAHCVRHDNLIGHDTAHPTIVFSHGVRYVAFPQWDAGGRSGGASVRIGLRGETRKQSTSPCISHKVVRCRTACLPSGQAGASARDAAASAFGGAAGTAPPVGAASRRAAAAAAPAAAVAPQAATAAAAAAAAKATEGVGWRSATGRQDMPHAGRRARHGAQGTGHGVRRRA